MSTVINEIRINKTRFDGLGFAQIARGLWMFIDTSTDAQIGAQYRRKDELLADLTSFAAERGFTA